MRLNRVNSTIDRTERNKINDNFDILERSYGKSAIDAEVAKLTAEQANFFAEQANNVSKQAKQVADNIDEKATQALQNSNDAVVTSGDAIFLAESVQNQFNQVVVEGDSSVEAAQARVSADATVYETLKERLDAENTKVAQQLTQSAKTVLKSNIQDTDYKAAELIDLEFIRQKQAVLYANYIKKFNRKEAIKIVTQGDSLTYGHDTVSEDKRPADTTPNADGVVHTQTRASITYPEALLSRLLEVNSNVIVENRGFSGDSVQDGFNRWKSKSNADLTIIDYGINDAQSYSNINGNLEQYFYWYEQLVIKTILQGSAVVLMSPTKVIAAGNVGLDINTFRKALKSFAEKYNLPVLDGDEMLRNYDRSIFTDAVHLNGKGYEILGTRIAAALLSVDLYNPLKVNVSSKLLTNIHRDNIHAISNVVFETGGGAPTPSETTTNETDGWVARLNQDGEILYSFYADVDDLVVIPYFQISADLTAEFELDFGVEQPRTSIVSAVGRANTQKIIPSTLSKDITGAWKNINKDSLKTNDNVTIHVTSKGWHTLKIKNVNTSSRMLYLHGLEFTHFDILKSLSPKLPFFDGVLYPTYQSPQPSISQTKIKLDDLKNLFGFDYSHAQNGRNWNDIPLKLTIHNATQSVLTYTILIGYNTSSRFISEPSRINIVSGTPTERILSSIDVDWTSNELILNWGGSLTYPSRFQISIT